LATISAKAAAAISKMPPAASLERNARNADWLGRFWDVSVIAQLYARPHN